MVSAARLDGILRELAAGRQASIKLLDYVDHVVVKVCLHPLSAPHMQNILATNLIQSTRNLDDAVVVDHGHKKSNGESHVCLSLKSLPADSVLIVAVPLQDEQPAAPHDGEQLAAPHEQLAAPHDGGQLAGPDDQLAAPHDGEKLAAPRDDEQLAPPDKQLAASYDGELLPAAVPQGRLEGQQYGEHYATGKRTMPQDSRRTLQRAYSIHEGREVRRSPSGERTEERDQLRRCLDKVEASLLPDFAKARTRDRILKAMQAELPTPELHYRI